MDENASILDITLTTSTMTIKVGDTFKAETSNPYIQCHQDQNKITITERKHHSHHMTDQLIIYVPQDMILDYICIETGAGQTYMSQLHTKILDLNLGAGKMNMNNVSVYETTRIQGGAGRIVADESCFYNMELELGAGELDLSAYLYGDNELNLGVGAAFLHLMGNDYRIKGEKGLGSMSLNNQSIKEDMVYGDGENSVNIYGGLGNVNIDLSEDE